MLNKKYQIIYADPPWPYDNPQDNLRSRGGTPYKQMTLEEIKGLPVGVIASDNCLLFLWATLPKIREALAVIEAWGFKYITCAFTWVKLNSNNMGIYSGLGYWTNGNAELCLLGKRGHPIRESKSVKQIVMAPVLEHSHKPPEVRERIIALAGNLSRIELFARQKVNGWDSMGFDIDGCDIKDSFAKLIAQEGE